MTQSNNKKANVHKSADIARLRTKKRIRRTFYCRFPQEEEPVLLEKKRSELAQVKLYSYRKPIKYPNKIQPHLTRPNYSFPHHHRTKEKITAASLRDYWAIMARATLIDNKRPLSNNGEEELPNINRGSRDYEADSSDPHPSDTTIGDTDSETGNESPPESTDATPSNDTEPTIIPKTAIKLLLGKEEQDSYDLESYSGTSCDTNPKYWYIGIKADGQEACWERGDLYWVVKKPDDTTTMSADEIYLRRYDPETDSSTTALVIIEPGGPRMHSNSNWFIAKDRRGNRLKWADIDDDTVWVKFGSEENIDDTLWNQNLDSGNTTPSQYTSEEEDSIPTSTSCTGESPAEESREEEPPITPSYSTNLGTTITNYTDNDTDTASMTSSDDDTSQSGARFTTSTRHRPHLTKEFTARDYIGW